MSQDVVADVEVAGHPQRRQVLAVCCLSLVLIVVAVSSLNIALPELQRGLDSSATQLLWIVDVYALVFAGTLLPAGALGDRFGRKGALLVGLSLFGTGALLAGLSSTAPQVIGARAVMGVGAGFVMPATLSIITSVFPPQERAKAIATWAGFAGAGGALGPVLSGLVLEVWDWNAVFFITLPVVGLLLALVSSRVPSSRDPRHTRLDPVGAALSVLGLFSLLFAIIQGPENGWTAPVVVVGFVAAAVFLVGFVVWELRTAHPMLDPRLFRVSAFAAGSATIMAIFFVMFGMFFLVPQFLQFVQGYSPLEAAVRLLPSGLTMIVVAPRGPAVAARIGAERSIAVGLLASACGFLILSRLGVGTAYPWLAGALVLMAIGAGLAMPPSTTAIVSSLPPAKAGVGSAMNDVTREVGGAMGIAVLGSIVSSLYRNDVAAAARELPAGLGEAVEESIGGAVAAGVGGGPAAAVVDTAREAFTNAANTAFVVAVVVMALGSAGYFRLHRAARRAVLPPEAEAVPVPGTEAAELEPALAATATPTAGSGIPCCR